MGVGSLVKMTHEIFEFLDYSDGKKNLGHIYMSLHVRQ